MKIKLLTGITLFIFWAIVTAVLTAGLVFNQNNQGAESSTNNPNSDTNAPAVSSSTMILSAAEVAKHNTSQSCWIIIDNKVYDFTSLLNNHSGGAEAMSRNCGKDGTNSFTTKDKTPGQKHSPSAQEMISAYYLGDLDESLNNNLLKTNSPPTTTGQLSTTPKPTAPSTTLNQSSTPQAVLLNQTEVAKHNTSQSCWIIIDNKVYDFTALINGHSGGGDAIAKNCGQDGTASFATKDKSPAKTHSASAQSMIDAYFIGNLNATITPNYDSATPPNLIKPEKDDDEFDD